MADFDMSKDVRRSSERNEAMFVARCAAALPILWLLLFVLALPFPGGHPSLTGLVLVLPASWSLTGRLASAFIGEPSGSTLGLSVLVGATLVELAFIGAAVGMAARSLRTATAWPRAPWLVALIFYGAAHAFGTSLITSRPVACVVLSYGSPRLRHDLLERVGKDRDRRYRNVVLAALENQSEPDVDEELIAALTWLEDGEFWHGYLTSPRGAHWGLSLRAKVLCDVAKKSLYLQTTPGVDFARLTTSFADLNLEVFDRMAAAVPERPDLLNPVFWTARDNPALGRTVVERLWEVLQHPAVAKCVRLGLSSRREWSEPSHPKHRLHELAQQSCQQFTRADLELWLSDAEATQAPGGAPLIATGLCQYIINSEGSEPRGSR